MGDLGESIDTDIFSPIDESQEQPVCSGYPPTGRSQDKPIRGSLDGRYAARTRRLAVLRPQEGHTLIPEAIATLRLSVSCIGH